MNRIALLGIVVFAGALAGCGDDAAALTEEEYLRQGNAICADGNEKLDAALETAFGDFSEEPEPEVMAAFFEDEFIPIIQTQLDGLRELDPPEELGDDAEQLLDDAQAALDQVEEQAKDDATAVFAAEEDPFADVNAKADELGLTECGDDAGDEGDDLAEEATADIVADPDHPYCDVEREVDAAFDAAFSALDADATVEEQQAASQEVAQALIDNGLLDRGAAAVPDVIRADFEVLAAAVRSMAEGNLEAFTDPAIDEAGVRVDAFCGEE